MKKKNLLLLLFLFISLFIVGCGNTDIPDQGEDPKVPTKEEIEQQVNEAFIEFDNKNFVFEKNTPTSSQNVNKVTFLSINDFHGALEESDGSFGAARMGGFIIDKYNSNPNGTVILAAGDMFQGTGISNYRHGRDVITLMNAIGFDAMVIGNHEFDWGFKEVLNYVDGNKANGEANFPFLACNIVYKQNEKFVENINPYMIIQKGNVKIGVIGFMGYGLESTIATSMIKDYKFLEPVSLVAEHAKYLRKTEKCDLVIAIGHDDNDATNSSLALLSGDSRIDAIFNGHNHLKKVEWINGTNDRSVPVLQGGSSGEAVSEITFTYSNGTWTCTNAYYHKMDNVNKNQEIDSFIAELTSITAPLFKRVLTVAGETIKRYGGIDWAVDALREYTKTDVAFINDGGIRGAGFPIEKGTEVTVANVYKIMPFDNTVKTVKLTGSDIIRLLSYDGLSCSTNLQKNGSTITINGSKLDTNKLYTVAAIDYIFDKEYYPFMSGQDINFTGILFRDVLIETLEKIGPEGEWKL